MSDWGGPSAPPPQGPPPGPGRRGGCLRWLLAGLGLLAVAAVVAAILLFGGEPHEGAEPPVPGPDSGSDWDGPSAPRE